MDNDILYGTHEVINKMHNKTDTKINPLKFNIINKRLYFNEIDITDFVVNYDLHGGDMHPKDVHHLKIELIIQI